MTGSKIIIAAAATLAASSVLAAAPLTAQASSASAAAWTTQAPATHPSTTANIAEELHGVSAVSASNAWAVGNGPIVHWNGTAWSPVKAPNAPYANLYGVSMDSRADGWAVGTYLPNPNGEEFKFLLLHWNGTSWAKVPSPAPGHGALYGVSMASASAGWAVGEESSPTGPHPVLLRWNGTSWARVSFPYPKTKDGGELNAVSARSATDAWAVGTYYTPRSQALVEHWNGRSWTQVPSPAAGDLLGVSTASATDAWAVGWLDATGSDPNKTLSLRWDGTSWAKVPSPSPGRTACSECSTPANELAAVAITSPSNGWAVGEYLTSGGSKVAAMTQHWNGTRWARVANPGGTTYSYLFGVSMVSATDGWAVGGNDSTGDAIILHWNGTTWSRD